MGGFDGVWVGGLAVLRVVVMVVPGLVGEQAPVTMVVVTAVRSAVTVTVAVPRTKLVVVLMTRLVLVTKRVEVS